MAILIELGRFDDAIEAITQHASPQELTFEKVRHRGNPHFQLPAWEAHGATWAAAAHGCAQAYCLYRLSNFSEALAVLQGGNAAGKPVARAQLEAQLHYRMGRNSDAIRVYHQLFKEHKVPQHEPCCAALVALCSCTCMRAWRPMRGLAYEPPSASGHQHWAWYGQTQI